MAANIYSSVAENNFKVLLIIVLFPLAISVLSLLIISLPFISEYIQTGYNTQALNQLIDFMYGNGLIIALITAIAAVVWSLISWVIGSNMILSSAGAIKVESTDKRFTELFNLVDNVAITAGIKRPEIYIIEDDSCNAFATGSNPNNSSVTFTTGILQKLNKQELEGVIAHEISHIINYDVRTMVLMISCIGFCTFMGEVILRLSSSTARSKDSKGSGGILILLGIALLIFGYIMAPLMRLAASRKQEYRADANAALLTRNPLALASALEKISVDSRVESLDSRKLASSICIANPLSKSGGIFEAISGLTKTHPPINERIRLLKEMGM